MRIQPLPYLPKLTGTVCQSFLTTYALSAQRREHPLSRLICVIDLIA